MDWCLTPHSSSKVISWWPVLLAEETWVPGGNRRPLASNWLPNMQTCIHVYSGCRHVIISTVLQSHLPLRPRWKEGGQLQIGSGSAVTRTCYLRPSDITTRPWRPPNRMKDLTMWIYDWKGVVTKNSLLKPPRTHYSCSNSTEVNALFQWYVIGL